jgi:hypothetical protein
MFSTGANRAKIVTTSKRIRGIHALFDCGLRQTVTGSMHDVRRTTASISHHKPFECGNWASNLIWGRNDESHGGEIFNLNGYVAESTVKFLDRNCSTRASNWPIKTRI